ncbi:acyl-ACP--UDP-N-acetylglucosamine O-acyltransferase [Desulfocurvibacter africanus]|uniref:Acyl-[acyl-carrier-protein]--UDP-N-acetylglucosamine O-acyltransferase n=1 Tax=Desulfocurvibacter africanus subsp. africanus str. Walvis Bay TaxID=690850 RepID=F3Z0Z8_DESAF|nr:acyl-ACP--UDP-N-acetylglucosamine O-acyltransferase [Desulfocurvibacter africanus]EGJ51076.1 Acyl-(acyl-carrier-protein)--UDP-N-acetylglucosamine O-acyltransferase [Desulfocurvibacter africanus subsp. africanus str. Walvis Bay]
MSATIHSTALVHSGAELADDVVVGPYCVIEDHVVIGAGTRLDAYAHVKAHTRIGKNNRIHSFACLGGEPQHLGWKGEDTYVEVGDNNVIREYVTIHRGTVHGLGYSKVGSNCMLMAYVHIAHDCEIADGVLMANAASLAGHVTVGRKAIISGMSGVHQFVRIGEFAFLGAMGGFNLDVPPYTLATGVRAKLHGLNLIGLKRNGFSSQTVVALKSAYKMIWRSDMIRQEALEEVVSVMGDYPEVMRLVDFIKASQRGVTPHAIGKSANNNDE